VSTSKKPWQKPTKPVAILAAIDLLLVGVLIGMGMWNGWSAELWGPIATWVAGGLTLAAVISSVWQAKDSMRRADAVEAERDESKRIAQIDLILPLWPKIAEIRLWYAEYKRQLDEAHELLTDETAPDFEAGNAILERLSAQWLNHSTELDLLFEPAVLKVVQPNIVDELTSLYREFFTLGNEIGDTIHQVKLHGKPNTKASDALIRLLAGRRRNMLQLIRHHLTRAPRIEFKYYPNR
jgi:hypothetical protein